jgi:RNA polymerase sigma-70 factor (ECF subfamily)
VHADAPTVDSTDWSQIVALCDQLYALRPNPVVALNRSVAVVELHGPVEGLVALADIDPASVDRYQPFRAARADLLARAGRHDEAVAAYDRAIELTTNTVERDFLATQRAALRAQPSPKFSGELCRLGGHRSWKG